MNPTDQASKPVSIINNSKFTFILIPTREGSPQTGIKEKQETKTDGKGRCFKRKRSPTNFRGNGENRSNGYFNHYPVINDLSINHSIPFQNTTYTNPLL